MVLVVSSKREVDTTRLSFIWVVKEREGGWVGVEIITTLCALYSSIKCSLYRIVKKKKHFQGEGGGKGVD